MIPAGDDYAVKEEGHGGALCPFSMSIYAQKKLTRGQRVRR